MTIEALSRQYLPSPHWGAVEAKILNQNPALAAPIIPADILIQESYLVGLLAVSAAAGNLTHQLDLDRPLYWCVTRAQVVNAMIAGYRTPDIYCVVIAEGVLRTVQFFVAALLAHKPLIKYLRDGSAPIDKMTPQQRTRREAWIELTGKAGGRPTEQAIESLYPLFFLAMHFLMAHEIGHLAGGHLDLFAGGFANESGGVTLSKTAESRALERDADAIAAMATVWFTGVPEIQTAWADIFTDKESPLRYFFTTTYILFSIMDLFGPDDSLGGKRTHPPAMVRVSTMSVMLCFTMHHYGAYTRDEVWELGRASVRAVEIAVMALGGGMMDSLEVQALEAEAQDNLQEHTAIWPELSARMDRKHLQKYFWSEPLR